MATSSSTSTVWQSECKPMKSTLRKQFSFTRACTRTPQAKHKTASLPFFLSQQKISIPMVKKNKGGHRRAQQMCLTDTEYSKISKFGGCAQLSHIITHFIHTACYALAMRNQSKCQKPGKKSCNQHCKQCSSSFVFLRFCT